MSSPRISISLTIKIPGTSISMDALQKLLDEAESTVPNAQVSFSVYRGDQREPSEVTLTVTPGPTMVRS